MTTQIVYLGVLVIMGIAIWMLVGAISVSNVETPPYKVVHKEKDYEVRTYAPQIVAEVTMDGKYRDAMSGGFRTLADFIFGNNKDRGAGRTPREIAMTAPVLERKTASARTVSMFNRSMVLAPAGRLEIGGWSVSWGLDASNTESGILKAIRDPVTARNRMGMPANAPAQL